MIDSLHCKSVQAIIYYENPSIYQSVVMSPYKKSFTSYQMDDKKGSILQFEFDKNIDKRFISFFNALIYGENRELTAIHSETISYEKNILKFFCFDKDSKLGKSILSR